MLSCGLNRFVYSLLFLCVVFSPYISSWLPKLSGLPVGPVLRDIAFIVLFASVLSVLHKKRIPKQVVSSYILFLSFVIFLFFYTESTLLQFLIGVHAFIVYPAVFMVLFVYFYNSNRGQLICFVRFISLFISLLMITMAIVAIIDVITAGQFTLLLGYDPGYGGEGFTLITRYYDLVRANGGFSDALAFGYLMVIAVIFFVHRLHYQDKSWLYLTGFTLCSIATLLTITRGAILSLFVVYVVYFFKSKYKLMFLSVGILLLLIIAIFGYIDVFMGRITDSDAASNASTQLRVVMAMNAMDYLMVHPMGVGPGTQGAGNIFTVEDQRINTDNFIFHSLIELGILGGLLFGSYLYAQFKVLLVLSKGAVAAKLLIFLFIASALFSSSLQSATLSVVFWTVCFIVMAEALLKRDMVMVDF